MKNNFQDFRCRNTVKIKENVTFVNVIAISLNIAAGKVSIQPQEIVV